MLLTEVEQVEYETTKRRAAELVAAVDHGVGLDFKHSDSPKLFAQPPAMVHFKTREGGGGGGGGGGTGRLATVGGGGGPGNGPDLPGGVREMCRSPAARAIGSSIGGGQGGSGGGAKVNLLNVGSSSSSDSDEDRPLGERQFDKKNAAKRPSKSFGVSKAIGDGKRAHDAAQKKPCLANLRASNAHGAMAALDAAAANVRRQPEPEVVARGSAAAPIRADDALVASANGVGDISPTLAAKPSVQERPILHEGARLQSHSRAPQAPGSPEPGSPPWHLVAPWSSDMMLTETQVEACMRGAPLAECGLILGSSGAWAWWA